MRDLKDLEEAGVELDSGQEVLGSLLAIAGDDLGSHMIGGFTENFSTSKYFCWYCDIDRHTFQNVPPKLGLPTPSKVMRTLSESCLCYLEVSDVLGIKFDSVFNSLKHCHVCDPGLPPCLRHDLFEGHVPGMVKPREVQADSKKLGGNAAQNWCLLRLLPLLTGD